MARGDLFSAELFGERKLLKNLEDMPDAVRLVLSQKMRQWVEMMKDAVVSNIEERLSKTDKLKKYSGSSKHLKDAVEIQIVEEGLRVQGRVYITGIPYAKAQESGAVTPPHVIRPRDAKVLAFMAASGHKVFALRVFHPGAVIPPTWYMRDAYRTVSPKITDGLYYQLVRKLRDQLDRG